VPHAQVEEAGSHEDAYYVQPVHQDAGQSPRYSKMNNLIERANRTLQTEFIDLYVNLLSDNMGDFKRELKGQHVGYNTERPDARPEQRPG